MTDKELIKQEIERRIVQAEEFAKRAEGANDDSSKLSWDFVATQNKSLLQFIDSLPEEPKCIYNRTLEERKKFCKYCSAACDIRIEEEPANEDLEEEIENYIKDSLAIKFPTTDKEQIKADIRYIARHFAEWQKQQIMKDAVEGTVKYEIGSAEIPQCDKRYQVLSDPTPITNAKLGDKVKIIIVKTEQQ